MPGYGRSPLQPRIWAIATLAAAAVLLPIVLLPQWLSKQARLDVLREHVSQVGGLAASVVDGDLHRRLLEPNGYTTKTYDQALAPLVRFHEANPAIFYVYTMVEREGRPYFVLDTAKSRTLKSHRELKPSAFLEPFNLYKEYASDWLQRIAAGENWVTPDFQRDDFGTFLTAHAPIHDSMGRYVGFSGVDFDLEYYLAQEARFRKITYGSLVVAVLLSMLIGYGGARYHYMMHMSALQHYQTSIRDGLTGLLNRRGVLDAIRRALARKAPSYATLLVDIDDLKKINDTHGHAAGDDVIARVALAIGESIRDGDSCARLGGDEFMVFAADCDAEGAAELARRLLVRLDVRTEPVMSVEFSVSIGIVVRDHRNAEFEGMYRAADAALYRAKSEGKGRFAMFQAA